MRIPFVGWIFNRNPDNWPKPDEYKGGRVRLGISTKKRVRNRSNRRSRQIGFKSRKGRKQQ